MQELQLLSPERYVDVISDALEALDALSVSVEDADAATPAERALFGEPGSEIEAQAWSRSVVKALFASEAAAQNAVQILSAQDFFAPDCRVLALADVPEQDWVRITQSQFEPVPITPDFFIVPSWHAVPAAAHKVIRLDPGLAFGTGTHPTTRMCLQWVTQNAAACQGARVLDYGCGSGILAIGAALHGAAHIDAVDIDPAAVTATMANAQANQVELNAGLPDACSAVPATYAVVLANILASPLKVLAPLLCGHVAAGGHLVLAGILERQAQELTDAYAPWVTLSVHQAQEGWVCMSAQKSPA